MTGKLIKHSVEIEYTMLDPVFCEANFPLSIMNKVIQEVSKELNLKMKENYSFDMKVIYKYLFLEATEDVFVIQAKLNKCFNEMNNECFSLFVHSIYPMIESCEKCFTVRDLNEEKCTLCGHTTLNGGIWDG